MSLVRVRFAPSPTGELHLGGARTALINYAFARSQGGKFILRIEDTDLERSETRFEAAICQALKQLGIHWDEGPDTEGAVGPYRQSERLPTYRRLAQTLLDKRLAYRCFLSEAELEALRGQAIKDKLPFRIPKSHKDADPEFVEVWVKEGKPYTIRMDLSKRATEYSFHDLLKGDITLPSLMVDDFVLVRSNGYPTYNFAVAVDDALMGITHVVRGEEHLSNSLRQLMVYEALDLKPPQLMHLPLIMGKDAEGKVTKLSKRHGDVSVTAFLERGFLPEAFVNYLLSLGYTHSENEELFTLEDVIANFSIKRLSHSSAFWDAAKLAWINGRYLVNLPTQEFLRRSRAYLEKSSLSQHILDQLDQLENFLLYQRDHIQVLEELPSKLSILEDMMRFPNQNGEASDFLKHPENREVFLRVVEILMGQFQESKTLHWDELVATLKSKVGFAGKKLFMSVRVALTNAVHGPELAKLVDIIPKTWFEDRLRRVLKWTTET
jgi:glutamyl-tRNA synthetase